MCKTAGRKPQVAVKPLLIGEVARRAGEVEPLSQLRCLLSS